MLFGVLSFDGKGDDKTLTAFIIMFDHRFKEENVLG